LDALGDGQAMKRAGGEGLEYQEIQCSLQEIGFARRQRALLSRFDMSIEQLLSNVNRSARVGRDWERRYSMLTFTGCTISLGSLPAVRIMNAIRPVALAGILTLMVVADCSVISQARSFLSSTRKTCATVALSRFSPETATTSPIFPL